MTEVDPNLVPAAPGAVVVPPATLAPPAAEAPSVSLAPSAGEEAAPLVTPPRPVVAPAGVVQSFEKLPSYTRSLLRVQVPVTVTLASKRQPIAKILELGPGAILQFDKSCEELLDLEVNGHRIGVGEAVKVGDKFGLRVTSMVLPDERFVPLRPRPSS